MYPANSLKLSSFVVLFLIVFSYGKEVYSAEFTCVKHGPLNFDNTDGSLVPSPCEEIYLSGRIQEGDNKTLLKLITTHAPFIRKINLNSPGGSVTEAMAMGRTIRKFLLHTNAPFVFGGLHEYLSWPDNPSLRAACRDRKCSCDSACFFVWMGGVQRIGNHLGLHRPRFGRQHYLGMSPIQAQKKYAQLLGLIRVYFREMEVPPRVLERMMEISSGDIVRISEGPDAIGFNIPLQGEPPSIAEWIKSRCGEITMSEIRNAPNSGPSVESRNLVAKRMQITNCIHKTLDEERWRIHQER